MLKTRSPHHCQKPTSENGKVLDRKGYFGLGKWKIKVINAQQSTRTNKKEVVGHNTTSKLAVK